MEFTWIQIMTGRDSTDKIIVTTDCTSPVYPFDGYLTLYFETAAGKGEGYVQDNFPSTSYVVKDIGD